MALEQKLTSPDPLTLPLTLTDAPAPITPSGQ